MSPRIMYYVYEKLRLLQLDVYIIATYIETIRAR